MGRDGYDRALTKIKLSFVKSNKFKFLRVPMILLDRFRVVLGFYAKIT
jgi:hypothetical protein